MTTLWQDLRFSLRVLAKDWVFTSMAIASLALAIGLNTAIFTYLNAVFLRPFPVKDPPRLISIVTLDASDPRLLPNSYPNYLDLRTQTESFTDLTAFQAVEVSLAGGDQPEQVIGQVVTGNYFDVLGVKAAVGRTFLPAEDRIPGAAPVTVLSHALWVRRFGSDPRIVGKTVTINGGPFTVVGVAAKGFKGTGKRTSFQLWVPLMMYDQVFAMADHLHDRDWLLFRIVGRLKPGISAEQAQAELRSIAGRLEREYPDTNRGKGVMVVPFMHEALGPNDRYLFVRAALFLTIVVTLLLLGTCANVANLLLARSSVRRKEMAIRLSIGASRFRLLRQLLTESAVLSLVAGTFGLLIAAASRDLLSTFKNPFFSEKSLDVALDGRVLGYALLVSAVTAIVFGIAPALRTSADSPVNALKDGSEASGFAPRRLSLSKAILAMQVALSFVSLMCAGWFLASLYNARQTDPGFEKNNLLLISFNLDALGYSEKSGRNFMDRILRSAEAVPGVVRATLAENRLLAGIVMARSVSVFGAASRGPQPLVPTNSVAPGYFETLGIPIVRGRSFQPEDRKGALAVAIVNEAMARQYWPGEEPIGKRFKFDDDQQGSYYTIVGVAKDSRFISLTQAPQPHLYLAFLQHYSPMATLYARTTGGNPAAALGNLRAAVQGIEKQLPLDSIIAADLIERSLWATRMGAILLAVFGALALILAMIGIYSVVAYSVRQRRAEIGIRMALGAARHDVLWLIVRQGMAIVAIGIGIGTGGALLLGDSVAGMLYGVQPSNPLILGGTATLLALVALASNALPARRAALLDPVLALNAR